MSKESTESEHQRPIPDWSVTDYVIDVETSNRHFAGTSANVYLQMFGEGGISEPIKLDIAGSDNHFPAFQRGQLDQFIFFEVTNYGRLDSIKIWHDSTGDRPNWHFAQATISNTKLCRSYRFACHRWLGENMDDGKICREVRCTEVTKGPRQAVQTATGVEKS